MKYLNMCLPKVSLSLSIKSSKRYHTISMYSNQYANVLLEFFAIFIKGVNLRFNLFESVNNYLKSIVFKLHLELFLLRVRSLSKNFLEFFFCYKYLTICNRLALVKISGIKPWDMHVDTPCVKTSLLHWDFHVSYSCSRLSSKFF